MLAIVERMNEKNANNESRELTYLYKQKLRTQFSLDGRWASILAQYTRVAADVVALDSELPLKSRDTIETISGDIPKLGLKLYLTEKQMKDVDAMIAQNVPLQTIIDKIFADTPRCIQAIWERIEDIFLSELSSGVGVSERSNGTGVRIDMNFYEENQFLVSDLWNSATSTPLDDIQKVFDKAQEDGNTITEIYLDETALQLLYRNNQVRNQYAFDKGIALTSGTTVPVLDFETVSGVFMKKWGVKLTRVNRTIKTEIDGVKKSHKPWKKGAMTFVCDEELGDLVWTTLAEENRPVAGVTYQKADEFILAKKYSKTDPLREFTAAEAMVVPVLNNVDRIYTLDTQIVQE